MNEQQRGERIAKFISRAGGPSRREAERLISEGKVFINGEKVTTPVCFVSSDDMIKVDGKILSEPEQPRVWSFYKPAGYITSDKDPEGRETIFNLLPKNLPRLMSVGRLDYNSEGLLLMTNDGGLKRTLELPKTGLRRIYRVRVFGKVLQKDLDKLAKGIVIDRIHYAPAFAEIDKIQGSNVWLTVTIHEGKNREIRNLMSHLGYEVNRLIRTEYGPFALKEQKEGTIQEIPAVYVKKVLAELSL